VLNEARTVAFAPTRVKAESGASLSTLARQCIAQGQGGLEWAIGIPGSVGGAVVGNAGAWGSDVASTLCHASLLEPPGSIVTWPVERFAYGYRTSALKRKRNSDRGIVLEAEFGVREVGQPALEAKAAGITLRRKASQPRGASCGSVFRNPSGDFAGRLIEAAGLKGRRSGGAEISTVHANFIINTGRATASDVKALIDLAFKAVQDQFDVALELEIELIGEW
jgi:UDP-N-acetylmuramate dehydrogenase